MNHEKKITPIATCSLCGKHSHNKGLIDEPCQEQQDSKPCKGYNMAMQREDDWEQCHHCQGSGLIHQSPCSDCKGYGWQANLPRC